MPLMPALGRQRQADLCEFEVSLVYRVSFRTAMAVTRKILSWKTKQNKKNLGVDMRISNLGSVGEQRGDLWGLLASLLGSVRPVSEKDKVRLPVTSSSFKV